MSIQTKRAVTQGAPYSTKTFSDDVIRLNANENAFGCSPKVREVLRRITVEDISRYPGYDDLHRAIADYEQCRCDAVAVAAGSDDILRSVFDTWLTTAQNVVLPVPTFSMNRVYLNLREIKMKEVLPDDGFSHAPERIADAVDASTGMILLVNPGAPVGGSIPVEQIVGLADRFPDVLIVVDEAYAGFAGFSVIPHIEERENILAVRTFSKLFGLAGLRIGYAVGAVSLIDALRVSISPYAVNISAAKAAVAALSDTAWAERTKHQLLSGMRETMDEIRKLEYPVIDTDANFFLFDAGCHAAETSTALEKKGVFVRLLDQQPGLDRPYIRVSAGAPAENDALVSAVSSFRNPDALLFDMDGVLINVDDSFMAVIRRLVSQLSGRDISIDEIQHYKEIGGGNNDWVLTRDILADRGVAVPIEEIIERFQALYAGDNHDGLILRETCYCDKVLLAAFAGRYRTGIITGRPEREARFTLNRFSTAQYFGALCGMDTGPENKPSGDGIRFVMERLGAKTAVYCGDNVDDMKAAVDAGVTGIGITAGSEQREAVLRQNGASFVIKTINDLTEIVL